MGGLAEAQVEGCSCSQEAQEAGRSCGARVSGASWRQRWVCWLQRLGFRGVGVVERRGRQYSRASQRDAGCWWRSEGCHEDECR